MKRVVVAVIVLALIVTGGILENIYVTKTFRELETKLKSLEQAVLAEDETALNQLRDISEWWEKRRTYIELFAYSPDVRAFSVAMGEAEGSLECGDYQNAASKCHSLIVMADNIKCLLDFNAEDII